MSHFRLADLLGALGPTALRVVCAPSGLEHQAGNPEFFDAADTVAPPPSALLLGVGLRTDGASVARAVEAAARYQAAALVIKCRGGSTAGVAALAERCGVTVLDADPDLPWRRLEALCTTAGLAQPRAPAAGLARVPEGDLFSLANAVAAVAGGAVAIMDAHHVTVAYSSLQCQPIDDTRRRIILERKVPADALASFLSPELWNSGSVVRIRRPGDMDRLAVVVRAGGEVLGSLWVAVTGDAVPADCEPALAEAAKLAAVHMLHFRHHVEAEQQRRDRALRALLEAGDEPAGLEFPAHLLTFTWQAGQDWAQHEMVGLQVQGVVSIDAGLFGLFVATALIGRRLYVMVPVTSGGGIRQATSFARHVADRTATSLQRDLTGVVSDEAASPAALREQRTDCDSALAHLARASTPAGVTDIGALRADLVLHRIASLVAQRPDLRSGLAQQVADHDASKSTRFGESLRAYLDAFGDVAAAAKTLHVHQNTLRHRLRRAQELFALDLQRPEHLLLLWLELAATAISAPAQPAPGTATLAG